MRTRAWIIAICCALAGCGADAGPSAPLAAVQPGIAVADPAAAPGTDAVAAEPIDPTEGLAVSPEIKAVLRETVERHYAAFDREVLRRVETSGVVDEESISALLAERQAALDAEIAAKLTPEQRRAFEVALER